MRGPTSDGSILVGDPPAISLAQDVSLRPHEAPSTERPGPVRGAAGAAEARLMALSATVYHLQIELNDVDRGVYQALDLRLARHPSESMRYLLTRVLAYCLCHEEGIAFGKGVSNADEPAVWVKDLQGNLRLWVEVGSPSPERLHKASKASPRVVIFTQHDPSLVQKAATGKTIHRAEQIVIHALDPTFLDALDAATDRNSRWGLVQTGGEIYVTIGEATLTTTIGRHDLVAAP